MKLTTGSRCLEPESALTPDPWPLAPDKLQHELPAVDLDRFPGDVAGSIGDEEGDDGGAFC